MKCDYCNSELTLIEGIWGWMYRCDVNTCAARYLEG